MEALEEYKDRGIYNFSPYIYYNNEQLMKDCCMIPYLFHRYLGYRANIITAKKEEYPYLEQLPGLTLDILPTPPNLEMWIQQCCEYIRENYTKIDVMFCFGAYSSHCDMVEQYKRLRPDGKVILKLDASLNWEDRIPFDDPNYKQFLSSCNVISVESKKLKKYLSRKWPYCIDYITNASTELVPKERVEYSEKKNTILTVGKIGSEFKANHILLEAFAKAVHSLNGWQLRLVGGIEPSFNTYIDDYFLRYPELKNRVVFTEKIIDKQILEDEYRKAKIFALTSIKEGGTPNVWSEAARNGCYIICSTIDAVDEATNWGMCGTGFEINNVEELSDILITVCNNEELLINGCQNIQVYKDRFFDYKKIIYKLQHLINLSPGGNSHGE